MAKHHLIIQDHYWYATSFFKRTNLLSILIRFNNMLNVNSKWDCSIDSWSPCIIGNFIQLLSKLSSIWNFLFWFDTSFHHNPKYISFVNYCILDPITTYVKKCYLKILFLLLTQNHTCNFTALPCSLEAWFCRSLLALSFLR